MRNVGLVNKIYDENLRNNTLNICCSLNENFDIANKFSRLENFFVPN